MSHTRRGRGHTSAALVGSVAALTLLSGCFGSDPKEPTAAHHTRHSRATAPTTPTEPTTSAPTSPTSPAAPSSLLAFSPRSGGKHLDDCQLLVPGDDPAEFVYYPVLVKASSPVTLDSLTTDHTEGVVEAGSWVATAGATPETGTFKGWPPKYVAHDSNLHWSQKMPANGATLAAGVSYNVFLRLQVDPTPGDSMVKGLQLAYHDANGAHTDTWVATTTFSMSC